MRARESRRHPPCPVLPLLAAVAIAGCAVAAPPEPAPAPPEPIVLDGRFEDWQPVPEALLDPADARGAVIDFGQVKITDDPQFVDLLVEIGREVNIQKLDGRVLVLLDADGNEKTGRRAYDLDGVDIALELTPPDRRSPDRPGMGIGLVSSGFSPDPNDREAKPLSPYLAGFAFAPTHASERVEMRLQRGARIPGAAALFTEKQFSVQLVGLDASGRVIDTTAPFTHRLTTALAKKPPVPDQPRDPLARPAGRTLRVVSWNAEFGSMFSNPQPFARVLAAIDPDVILFQELRDEDTAEMIHAFLSRAVKADRWLVLRGDGGGDLRCAVASRLPMSEVPALRLLTYPDRRDRSLRVAVATVEFDGRRILVASVHLKCCGSIDSREDRTRLEEVSILNRAMAVGVDPAIEGIVIAGDLNLVGGRKPLEVLAASRDVDGTDLQVAEVLQLDGRTNATWSDTDQPFVPGRLDYLLFSDASLSMKGGFVLDASDLAPRWIRRHRVRPDDTANASDHLPVVVDLGWSAPDS